MTREIQENDPTTALSSPLSFEDFPAQTLAAKIREFGTLFFLSLWSQCPDSYRSTWNEKISQLCRDSFLFFPSQDKIIQFERDAPETQYHCRGFAALQNSPTPEHQRAGSAYAKRSLFHHALNLGRAHNTTLDAPAIEYTPIHYTAPSVLANDKTKKINGWAELPEGPHHWHLFAQQFLRLFVGYKEFPQIPSFVSFETKCTNQHGVPLNPIGRTGVIGRGLLGNWGANHAADPIITLTDQDGNFSVILIQRKDSGQWALPGGMLDPKEKAVDAMFREFCEEALGNGDALSEKEKQEYKNRAYPVYAGYVDDPRNTDNAWMETRVFHLHIDQSKDPLLYHQIVNNLVAGDDAKAVRNVMIADLSKEEALYASHQNFVLEAFKTLVARNIAATLNLDSQKTLLKFLEKTTNTSHSDLFHQRENSSGKPLPLA